MKLLFLALLFLSVNCFADSRFCGEPERYANGVIKRNPAVVAEFERLYPLPPQFSREKFQVNHAIPRVCGGCDTIENMIWMAVPAKTCAEWYCQDRHEQLTMCPKSYHK